MIYLTSHDWPSKSNLFIVKSTLYVWDSGTTTPTTHFESLNELHFA